MPLLEQSQEEEACTKDVTLDCELIEVRIVTIIVLGVKVLMLLNLIFNVLLGKAIGAVNLSRVINLEVVLISLGH